MSNSKQSSYNHNPNTSLLNSLICILSTLFTLVIATGCSQHHLSVQTQYLTHETLASYHVNTPDPKLTYPTIGQRLLIKWTVPRHWLTLENPHLEIQLRYRNREEQTVIYPLTTYHGTYIHYVAGDDYCRTEGILSYKIDLIANDCVYEEWRHQLWADLIHFNQ